jgi:cytochrome P450
MPLLAATMKETLRMYSPPLSVRYTKFVRRVLTMLACVCWLICGRCRKDLIVDGYLLPKDRFFSVTPHMIHHNPETYPNPYQFDVTRWLGGEPGGPNTFVPFGRGPHKCLGSRLAEYEVRLFVALLLQKYKLKLKNVTPDVALDVDRIIWFSPGYPIPAGKDGEALFELRV